MKTMKCPVCNADLQVSDRQGIEIDYCPQCRGIWLDRGELDKILERSVQADVTASRSHQPRDSDDSDDDYRKKRRKSFFEELFD